jgi:hydroxymethylbilane synthase
VLRLGARGSALAQVQALSVARTLERAHRARRLKVQLVALSSEGDRRPAKPLRAFKRRGVFVKELQRALLDGRIDAAVHSLKDMPLARPEGVLLAAVAAREDPREVCVLPACAAGAAGRHSAATSAELHPGARLGAGSPRRRLLSDLASRPRFAEIRGNIETRLRKVAEGRYDGTLLALAGLKRLRLVGRALQGSLAVPGLPGARLRYQVLSLQALPPAPGQGALGIECRARDRRTRELLAAAHCRRTAACVAAERACLGALGGGCHLPLGAYAEFLAPGRLRLRAWLADEDGRRTFIECEGAANRPEALGRRAARRLRAPAPRASERR